MKVIFLDFDGVVMCLPPEKDRTKTGKLVRAANRDAVAALNEIVQRTDAKVVVSSTWRKHHNVERLQGVLDRAGFVGEVVDATPVLFDYLPGGGCKSAQRGREIADWIRCHMQPAWTLESYVVLDDDYDLGPLPPERWVLVKDGWFNGGLKAEHVAQAVKVLGAA